MQPHGLCIGAQPPSAAGAHCKKKFGLAVGNKNSRKFLSAQFGAGQFLFAGGLTGGGQFVGGQSAKATPCNFTLQTTSPFSKNSDTIFLGDAEATAMKQVTNNKTIVFIVLICFHCSNCYCKYLWNATLFIQLGGKMIRIFETIINWHLVKWFLSKCWKQEIIQIHGQSMFNCIW